MGMRFNLIVAGDCNAMLCCIVIRRSHKVLKLSLSRLFVNYKFYIFHSLSLFVSRRLWAARLFALLPSYLYAVRLTSTAAPSTNDQSAYCIARIACWPVWNMPV